MQSFLVLFYKYVHTVQNWSNFYKAEEAVTASLLFPGNIIGSGIWNFNTYKEVDTFNNDPIIIETNEGIKKISIDNPPHVQLPLIQKIVDELLGNNKSLGNGYTSDKPIKL